MYVLEVKSSLPVPGELQNPVLGHSCCLLRQPAVCEKGMNGCPDLRNIGLKNESGETPSGDATLLGYTSA